MKSIITSTDTTTTTMAITLSESTLQQVKLATYAKLRPRVKAAGFRPGKAPDSIVERELGSNTIQNEVLEEAVMQSYAQAVQEHKLQVIASPAVKIQAFVPYTELKYEVTVDIMPKIEVGDYKSIRQPEADVTIATTEIDEVIEDLRKRLGERKEVDQAAKVGNEVVFDFSGTKNGEPVEGATAKNYSLMLGSKTFIPGFEEELVGLKAGDAKTFGITFPKDYSEKSLAGQKVKFEVLVHKINEIILPKLDESFVAKVSPLKTVPDLRQNIEDRLRLEKKEQAAKEREEAVLNEVLKRSTYTVPPKLADQQVDKLMAELEQNLAYRGLDMEKYQQLSGKNLTELRQEMRPQAEKRVGLAMVLTEIAKAEKLEVEHDEVHQEIDRLKAQYPDPAMQSELASESVHEDVYNHLMAGKTIARIMDYVDKN